ncbi:MAG TPA: hypothetical protein VNA24_34250 [Hyalangium sp.]|nr:hypothetical protein [Hyalangium sp.]
MSETGSATSVANRAIIREARPEDDFAIGELLVDAYITKYAQKMPEVVYTEERKRSLRDVADKRAIAAVLVAEVDGEVAGTVALFPPGAPGADTRGRPGAAHRRPGGLPAAVEGLSAVRAPAAVARRVSHRGTGSAQRLPR